MSPIGSVDKSVVSGPFNIHDIPVELQVTDTPANKSYVSFPILTSKSVRPLTTGILYLTKLAILAYPFPECPVSLPAVILEKEEFPAYVVASVK